MLTICVVLLPMYRRSRGCAGENRFFVRGKGNILYHFNYGKLASDRKTDTLTFPILQEVISTTWKKEDQLQPLKSDFAALDRKILLSLKPIA